MFNKIKNNLQSFIKDNLKFLLFILVFAIVCFIYNINNDFINYISKKGTLLEYSINQNQTIDKEAIKNELIKNKIKYFDIKSANLDVLSDAVTDYEFDKIHNILVILIPYKAEDKFKPLINNISDYIFNNYPNSKLIDLKPLNGCYSTPYFAFNLFLVLFFISLVIWLILIAILFDLKTYINEIINETKEFFIKQKQNLKNLIQKTKQKGLGYFLKRILLDDGEQDEETSALKEILSTIIFVLVCVILIRYFIGELRWIPSGSMRPTILEHDRVFVQKLDYPKKEIKRGDILVFYPPEVQLSNTPLKVFSRLSGIFCNDIAFIKRVIGMPGDKFEVKYYPKYDEYRVLINDKPLNEPYIISKTNWTPCTNGMYCGPFIIPKDNYFMMGDNRGNSQDSRFWGFMDKSRVIGRANFMFWPIRRINRLKDNYIELNEKKTFNKTYEKRYILNRYEFLYKI